MKMNQDYINLKIRNCKKLIQSSTSEAQKKIYKEYLVFWQLKEFDLLHFKNGNAPKNIGSIIQDLTEAQRAEEFRHKYPNKKAYYKRNGKYLETRRFKEFLKSFE